MPGIVRSAFRFTPFAAALLIPLLGGAQAQSSTGAISGVVVDSTSGEVVPDAVVFLSATPARQLGRQSRQMTDEKGRFVFVNLPGDVIYTISATKLGFLEGGYGRDTMPNNPLRPIPLKPDEWIPNVKVSISKPAAISGVVRDESGEPVVGVVVRVLQRVRIQGREDFIAGAAVRTDDRGMYRVPNLTPGRYLLQVPSVQATIPSATKLPSSDDGRQIPIEQFEEALNLLDVDEAQRLVIGRYPLPPPPVNGRQMSYPAVFFPSALAVADATTITLKYGEDRAGVDLTLTPVPSVRVSGVVEGPKEALDLLSLRLLPAGLENVGFGVETATALVAPDGRFTFLNVPAGAYVLDAPVRVKELTSGPLAGLNRPLAGPPTTPVMGATSTVVDLIPGTRLTTFNHRFNGSQHSARMPLNVGTSNVTGVIVRMQSHATMNGRVVIEPDPDKPNSQPPARFNFVMDPITGDVALANPLVGPGRGGSPGQFVMQNIAPGQYWLRILGTVQAPSEWVVKSIAIGGRDFTNVPIDATTTSAFEDVVVTVTNATAELSGTVRGTEELKADTTMVIAFPTDSTQWKNTGLWPSRVKSTAVSSSSAFRLTLLPGGEYFVAAVDRGFASSWQEPEFLARVARTAQRVTLTWGGTTALDLTAAVIR